MASLKVKVRPDLLLSQNLHLALVRQILSAQLLTDHSHWQECHLFQIHRLEVNDQGH